MLSIKCKQCKAVWEVPESKKGGQVNCPSCGLVNEVPGASDAGWFYGLAFGGYALIGLPLGIMAVIGMLNGEAGMAICSGSAFAVVTIILLFIMLGS